MILGLIPADNVHGGECEPISKEHVNIIIDGSYKFARRTLTNIKVHKAA